MQEGSRRAVIAALLANFGIAIAKFVGFVFTGAASLLAEGVHSVADTGNQALLILGSRRAELAPTRQHPFGYGRERFFWAFVVAVVLFTMGSLFAIYEGVQKLRDPHELSSPAWAIGILVVAVVFESFALWNAVREADRVRGRASWWEFVRHAKSPELPVVLLEDSGALLGLLFALIGIGLAIVTGDPRFDALGSVAIGVLLGVIAWVLAAEMKSLLIGEAAAPRVRQVIVDTIESDSHVKSLIQLRTQHIGPEELLVCADVELASGLSTEEVARAIDALETVLRSRVDEDCAIYIEPEIRLDPKDALG